MLLTMLAVQGVGLVATLLVLGPTAALPELEPTLWAGVAGLSGTLALGAYFVALSRGSMGLISPLAALIGAGVPATVGVLAGEELGDMRLGGLLLGLVAVVMISLPSGRRTAAQERALRIDIAELPYVLASGLGFAGFYLALDRALVAGADFWWALAAVRVVGVLVIVAALAGLVVLAGSGARRQRLAEVLGVARIRAMPMATLVLLLGPLLLVGGVGDLGGNGFFIAARQHDLLSVSVVLSSLYPVVTTLLAAAFLGERLSRLQLLGVALAVTAVALIGLG